MARENPRFQEIKTSTKGEYITYNGKRYYVDEFNMLNEPETITDEFGNEILEASGYINVTSTINLYIEFSDCRELAKVASYDV